MLAVRPFAVYQFGSLVYCKGQVRFTVLTSQSFAASPSADVSTALRPPPSARDGVEAMVEILLRTDARGGPLLPLLVPPT